MSWAEFWNADTPIYVNQRHREKHYRAVASSIAALVASPASEVLDFGCGEALSADLIAGHCAKLHLCERASTVRDRLRETFGRYANVEIVDETLASVAGASIDLLVVNSVVQYLSQPELSASLALWRAKLAPAGRLIIADVLPKRGSAFNDVLSLLRFAAAEGFFLAAVLGLLRTAVSPYPRLRRKLGLARFEEAEMLALLAASGFAGARLKDNLGHDNNRMAFAATAR